MAVSGGLVQAGSLAAVPRWVAAGTLLLGLAAGGCHHKRVQPIVLPQQTPVALEPVTQPAESVLLETPKHPLPPVPVAEAASKPKPKKKRSSKPVVVASAPATAPAEAAAPAPAPSAVAADIPAETTVIGALTPGGEQSPKTQQEATELIAENERRLRGIPDEKLKAQRSLVSKVRNFQRQAQQAMRTGDAEGAKTLATKAKLLLDDLEKEGQGG